MDNDINYIILESIKGDKKSQEILIKKLYPLIYKNIYKYYKSDDVVVEDLVQEGCVVILKSLKTFDETHGVHFLGYIKTNLSFFYKNYYRNTKNQRNIISLNQKIADWNNNQEIEDVMMDDVMDPIEEVIRNNEIEYLLANIKRLSIKDQNVLNLYYIDELSMAEISDTLDIGYRATICRKYNAVQKLRKLMGGEKNG